MNIQDKITFFYAMEESLWDEKVEANKYFGTLSILFIALVGAYLSVGSAMQAMLSINVEPSMFASMLICIYVWGLNVAESIVASTDWQTALKRSLLMLVAIILAFGAGVIAGGIVVFIVGIFLFIFFCSVLLKMFFGTNGVIDRTFGRENVHAKDQYGNNMTGRTYEGPDGRMKFQEYGTGEEFDIK